MPELFFARDSLFHYSHTCRSVCSHPKLPLCAKDESKPHTLHDFFYIYGVGEEEGEREDRVRRGDREVVERKQGDSVKSKKLPGINFLLPS